MSDAETKPNQCPRCGVVAATKTPTGVCTRCALELALLPTPGGQAADPLFLQDIPVPGKNTPLIGDYEVLGVIAHGGMGVVFRARQRSLKRIVALKLLLGGAHANPAFKRRFRQEAEVAARLQHPNIVPIFEIGEHEGQPFFSMEFIDGPDLARITRERSLTPPQAAEYVAAIAIAIEYAHHQGVVHRDLKPSNILIGPDDRPRITDFGLARRMGDDSDLTIPGATLGTPSYLPPEQASAKRGRVGPHSDIYALGAVLYHLLTGRPPFMTGSVVDTLQQVLETEPAAPRTLNRAVPGDLETICLKCLQKSPAARYPAARELAADLRRWLNNVPIMARPPGLFEPQIKWCQRRPAVTALTAALVLTILLAIAGLTWQWQWMERLLFISQRPVAHAPAITNAVAARAPAASALSVDQNTVGVADTRVEAISAATTRDSSPPGKDTTSVPIRPMSLDSSPAESRAGSASPSGGYAGGLLLLGGNLPASFSSTLPGAPAKGVYATLLRTAGTDLTNALTRISQGKALWMNNYALARIRLSVALTLMNRISAIPSQGRGTRGRRGPRPGVDGQSGPASGSTNLDANFQPLLDEATQLENQLNQLENQLDSTTRAFLQSELPMINRSPTPSNAAETSILTIETFDASGVTLSEGVADEPAPNDRLFIAKGAALNPSDFFDRRGIFLLVDLRAAYGDTNGGNLRSESLNFDYFQKIADSQFVITPVPSAGIQWEFGIQQSNSGSVGDEYVATFKLVNYGNPKNGFDVIAWEGPEGQVETDATQVTLPFPKRGRYKIKVFGLTTDYQSEFAIPYSVSF
jgi:serine/threonine protein kinase